MALPPLEQRHGFLRYEGLEYTDSDIADFESRLERIYTQEIHRVQVVDFQGMPELLRDGLFARMAMEHRDEAGGARRRLSWRQFILALGLHTGEEMVSHSFARDPVLETIHRMMAHVLWEKSGTERRFANGRKSGRIFLVGSLYADWLSIFWLLNDVILGVGLMVIALSFSMIDMVLWWFDTYFIAQVMILAWVGHGTRGQPDACGCCVLAPLHALGPPPPHQSAMNMLGWPEDLRRTGMRFVGFDRSGETHRSYPEESQKILARPAPKLKPGSKFSTLVHGYDTEPSRIFTQQMQEWEQDDFRIWRT
ncbi:hypothetical protein Tco_0265334 [Tanacetum coccineum]